MSYKIYEQERQNELGLKWDSFKYRNYDPAIARFMSIDPLAETSRRISPYVYALNNPVYFIDPDGMDESESEIDGWGRDDGGTWHYDKNLTETNYNDSNHNYTAFAADGTTRHGAAIEYADGTKGENGDVYLGFSEKDFYYIDSRTIDNENNREIEIDRNITESEVSSDIDENRENSASSSVLAGGLVLTAGTSEVPPAAIAALILTTVVVTAVKLYEGVHSIFQFAADFQDNFAQHGKNRVTADDVEILIAKEEAGTITNLEKQKLKKHRKGTGEKSSRQTKDKK